MKFKRVHSHDSDKLLVEWNSQWYSVADLKGLPTAPNELLPLLADWDHWKPLLESALTESGATPFDPDGPLQPLLPFTPLSLRDYMLSETHATNAARGFVKHFMPTLYPIIIGYERLLRRPFPALRPKPIWYRQPVYYFSNHMNMACEGDTVHWPAYTDYLDYELELAFVLAKPLLNVTREQALQAIGGFMVLNDFSARDVQLEEMRSGFGPQKSKHFVNALSATVVSADAILPRVDQLKAEVRINNRCISQTHTGDFQHSIADMLVHASRDEPLYPGEVFATGTLPNGCAMENDHWLQPGDTIELWIEAVGSLTNTISKKD